MKGKCKYCNKRISTTEIRCETCNNAWHGGYDECEKKHKFELSYVIDKIKKLVVKE